jgi:hypothetical protein
MGQGTGLEPHDRPFHQDYDAAYGILIEGRDRPPAVSCGHTPPYYEQLVVAYGFTPFRPDNLAFALDISKNTREFELLHRSAERAAAAWGGRHPRSTSRGVGSGS